MKDVRRIYLILAIIAVIVLATFVGLKSVEYGGSRYITLQQIGEMANTGKLPKSVFYLAVFEKLKNPKVYFKEDNGVIYVYNGNSKQMKLSGRYAWQYTVYKENVLRGRVILKNKTLTFIDVCLNPINNKYLTLKLSKLQSCSNKRAKSVRIKIIYDKKVEYTNLTTQDLSVANSLAFQILSEVKKDNLSKEYEIELVTYGLGSAVSESNDLALSITKFSAKLVKINNSKMCKFEKILFFGSGSIEFYIPNTNVSSRLNAAINAAILDSAVLNCMGFNTAVFVKNSKAYLLIKNVKLVYNPIKLGNSTYYAYNPTSGFPVSKI